MSERYNPLRETFTQNPIRAREIFQALHQSTGPLDDCFIDDVLGLPLLGNRSERFGLTIKALIANGKYELLDYQGTEFGAIREVLDWVKPTSKDTVYDLGCGYGRVCLYGSLTTDAQYKGVDLVVSRLETATRSKEQLGSETVEFIRANVIEHDFSDGTIFYLFNPFTQQTLDEVLNNLRMIAEDHPISIASYWTWERDDEIPSWLRTVNQSSNYKHLYLLEPKS